MTEPLRAHHEISFRYRHSVGGAKARFLAGLRDARILASVGADGRVTVPPVDWDPETGTPTTELVPVGDRGIVASWTWDGPTGKAVALVRPVGADTCMVHVVDVADETALRTGMVVRADWRAERTGSITDIRAFVPCDSLVPAAAAGVAAEPPGDLAVVSETCLSYTFEPGLVLSDFLRTLANRRIAGGRCVSCDGVYVPPRPKCPDCMVGPLQPVPVSEQGIITAFTVVHVPFHGMEVDLPFVCAWIRLAGASVSFAHLLGGVSPADVTVGQRVEAVWATDTEPSWESIRWFRPIAEGTP